MAVRKGRITEEKALAFLESRADLPIEVENPTRTQISYPFGHWSLNISSPHTMLPTSNSRSVTTLPIASSDKALTKAARIAGVNLIEI